MFEMTLCSAMTATIRIIAPHGQTPKYGADGDVVEPLADAVTEETLAKVVFEDVPERSPPVGELVEVTVALPDLRAVPVVPNACVQRVDGRLGVWLIDDGDLRFTHVKVGASDLDGRVQILDGLDTGQRVVVYSQRSLKSRNRVKIVERLPGVSP